MAFGTDTLTLGLFRFWSFFILGPLVIGGSRLFFQYNRKKPTNHRQHKAKSQKKVAVAVPLERNKLNCFNAVYSARLLHLHQEEILRYPLFFIGRVEKSGEYRPSRSNGGAWGGCGDSLFGFGDIGHLTFDIRHYLSIEH